MAPPKRWTPGDPLSADRLNQTVFESAIPRREVVLGHGSSLVNESLGNQTANMRSIRIKLVVAVENFAVQTEATDLNEVIDDVPSGLVREVRLNRKTGAHGKETLSGDFRVWDPVAGLTGTFCDSGSNSDSASASEETSTSTKSLCDVFHVVYNEDSKRWEVFAGGGAPEIYHAIITGICDPVCSTYYARRVRRYLVADCEDCDSASASESV